MKPNTITGRLAAFLVALTILASTSAAFGQQNPSKLVLGFPAGGPIDAVARIINVPLGKELGSSVIVENRAGANAGIAAEYVAKSDPDGRTLFMTSTGAVAISPALYANLGYNPVRDFEPVSLVVSTAEVLVVRTDHPANTIGQFIDYARKQNAGASLASSGSGSIPHLAAELFAEVTGIKMLHVPYKGVAPAITDVVAGHVDGIFIDVPVALAQIKGGKLKALGLAAPQRHAALPNTVTFDEAGIKGVDSANWYAIFAPKGTPAAIVERLNQGLQRALASPEVKKSLLAIGAEPSWTTPSGLAHLLKSDLDKWGRIIREKKITAE